MPSGCLQHNYIQILVSTFISQYHVGSYSYNMFGAARVYRYAMYRASNIHTRTYYTKRWMFVGKFFPFKIYFFAAVNDQERYYANGNPNSFTSIFT